MATIANLRALVARHRVQAEAIGLAALVSIVAIVLGVRARQSVLPARAERDKLSAAATEVASFRSSFRASTPEQDMRVAQLADSLGIAVARNNRVSLAQEIAAAAEELGLADVRVRFAPADSAVAPTRPEVSRVSIAVADYTLALEGSGSLAAVLSLVNQLPASVALQRLTGATVNGRTRYDLVLAVFESTDAPTVGTARGAAVHD